MLIGRLIILLLLLSSAVSAQYNGTHETFSRDSLNVALIASGLTILLIIGAVLNKNGSNPFKAATFLLIVLIVTATTLYLSISTVLLNIRSESNGPVHWHTDFEIWKCDERLDLKDPVGLSNRIGTPVFHEHNDQRIHIEGVVTKIQDVNLQNFFEVIGGSFSSTSFALPTTLGNTFVQNGESCPSGEAKLQVFLYHVINPDPTKNSGFLYQQTKLNDFTAYVPAPYVHIPPGDCIIIEFDVEKERTEKICETYRVAREKGLITEVNNGS